MGEALSAHPAGIFESGIDTSHPMAYSVVMASKTEQRIMEVLNERGRFTAESWYGKGAEGGKVSGGMREHRAALKLVSKGLATVVNEYNTSSVKSGYTIHIHGLSIIAGGN